jgi:succinate-semialdehyde dehydrogenase/glutarate-semialdehyde dehydrogenase
VAKLAAEFGAGMMSVNLPELALPEVQFGGVKESGCGVEGGIEAMDAYLTTKFLSHLP